MKLTYENIHAAGTSACGFNRQQLGLLGVPWPPKKGWLSQAIGTEISDSDFALFTALKGVRLKRERAKILGVPMRAFTKR